MKKRGRLRKGMAMLLSLAMVVGLMPGVSTIKVSAAESRGAVVLKESYMYKKIVLIFRKICLSCHMNKFVKE